MMFFRRKMDLVYAAKKRYDYLSNVFELQVQHFEEFGFEPPIDVDAELERGSNLVRQFELIRKDPVKNLFERAERKSMLVGFERIFIALGDDLEEEIQVLCDDWNRQFRETYKEN